MKVVFFGTPEFAAKTLDFLLKNGVSVVAVVTKPDKPQGRSGKPQPTPVKQVALMHIPPLPLFQPVLVSNLEFAPTLEAFKADLFVVVAYGEIIKQHLLDMPRLGCINVHASILPKYRGAAPIQQSIIQGEKETGVTIMHMVKKMDAGDIIKISRIPIAEETTTRELEEALCTVGSEALLEVIRSYEKGVIPERHAQDHNQATLAPKIELENCQIDWNKPAVEIHNLVRGVNPEPGAWCYATVKGEKKRIKINRTKPIPDISGKAGAILRYGKEGFIVGCGTGALKILELQMEGKRLMKAEEFIPGTSQTQILF